jgi:hypothetical protein
MRPVFALALMALATGIPLCAQQGQQNVKKVEAVNPVSSGFAIKLPPMVESMTTKLLDPSVKEISSGFVIKVPDVLPLAPAK